jgi:hypothetical protein
MMEENEQLISLINKDLGEVSSSLIISTGIADRNIIRDQLAFVIAKMLENNFERLCQAMYRLDVSEIKFHQVLHEKPSGEIPFSLADLVIERELQKVKTRMMYRRKEL